MTAATIKFGEPLERVVPATSSHPTASFRSPSGLRLSVRLKLLLAFAVTTCMTVLIASVALDTQQEFSNQQSTIQTRLLPAISSAKALQDVTRKIVAIGPAIVAAKNADELDSAIAPLAGYSDQAMQQVNQLRETLGAETIEEKTTGAKTTEAETGRAPRAIGADIIDERTIEKINTNAANLTETLAKMALTVDEIDQLVEVYTTNETQVRQSISNILQRIKGISDTTHRDSKISITDISVAIDRGGEQSTAREALRKLSQEKLDVFRWVFSLMDTASALDSAIQRIRLTTSAEEALELKPKLYLLSKTLQRVKRAAPPGRTCRCSGWRYRLST